MVSIVADENGDFGIVFADALQATEEAIVT
jgi:hypothetical protein